MKDRSLQWEKTVFIFSLLLIFKGHAIHAQVDSDATYKTKSLYFNLKRVQESDQFLFGQEFFNSFRYSSGSAHGDEQSSDSKTITGAHPAVLGSDFHYYLEKDATERSYHTEAVKWAYQQGYVITFDWHLSARGRTSYVCSSSGSTPAAPPNLARNIANGNTNGDRDWYLGELDKVIDIINNDLVVGDDTIPIVFRPLHEMNGNWFWWGVCSGLSDAEYKSFYQLTVDYVKERTRSVLFCWSPNTPFGMNRYPGDEYVDVIGVDAYEVSVSDLRTQVGAVVDQALTRDKVAVFSETGDRNADATAALYWKNIVLPGIMSDPNGKAKNIAWVLTWINASWSEPYVPHSSSSATVKQSFIDFRNSDNVVFGDEIPFDMYTIDSTAIDTTTTEPPPVTSIENLASESADLELFPMPSENVFNIVLNNFQTPSKISIYDTKGTIVREIITTDKKIMLCTDGVMKSGMYLIRASDKRKSVIRKLVVE